MRYPLRDIQANPHRNIDRYPINQDKVEKLKESIERTDFWDNVVARLGPDGKPQIGYGHHRLVALRELFPPEHEVDLILKPLDDEAMLHVMADENMKEWASTVEVTVETVRAVRDFLADSAPARNLGHGAKPENGAAIKEFLGWPEGRVDDALAILNAEKAGALKPEDTAGLGIEQATILRRATQRITDKPTKAKAIRAARKALASGAIGKRGIRDVVREVEEKAAPKQPKSVLPHEVAAQVAKDVEHFWSNGVTVDGRTVSRRDIVQLMAANRNAEGVRNYIGTLRRVIADMTTTNEALLELLTDERTLEVVS